MDLDVTTAVDAADRSVLTLRGALDLQSRTLLIDTATSASNGRAGLILDLAGVNFIDSTGIGAIVQLAGDAEDRGIGFALRDPSPRVIRVLQVVGLHEAWPIEPAEPTPV